MRWDEIYLKYVEETGYDAFKNGDDIDWDAFFRIGGYQGHHKFPVNLFADKDGAWRFMFENMPAGEQRNALVTWFNSAENGIMVPNKRIVDGREVVIHTNHAEYEESISDVLNDLRREYVSSRKNYTNEEIAAFLFEDVRELSVELENMIIRESLLKHRNINELRAQF